MKPNHYGLFYEDDRSVYVSLIELESVLGYVVNGFTLRYKGTNIM